MVSAIAILEREMTDGIEERKRRLLDEGFTTREVLGLDPLSAFKWERYDAIRTEREQLERFEREHKRRKVDHARPVAGPSRSKEAVQPVAGPSREREAMEEDAQAVAGPSRVKEVYNPWDFKAIEAVRMLPAFASRNHYCIQWHHATAIHFDLRLVCTEAHKAGYCDVCTRHHSKRSDRRVPGTLSFAIPKGLSGMKKGEKRLAVEQPMHPIHYSAFEGSGVGTTLLHDVGVYEVLNSASGKRDKGADTDDDDEGEEDDCELLGGRRGMNHEKALARAYRGYPEEDMTSFVVKLTGVRYNMTIALSSSSKFGRDKWSNQITRRKQWIVCLATDERGRVRLNEEAPLGPESILTGRTMAEIKAEGNLLDGAGPRKVEGVSEHYHASDFKGEWAEGGDADM